MGQISGLENKRGATETGRIAGIRIRRVVKRYEVTVVPDLAPSQLDVPLTDNRWQC